MNTLPFQASVLLGLAAYPIFEGDRFSTGFSEVMVLILYCYLRDRFWYSWPCATSGSCLQRFSAK